MPLIPTDVLIPTPAQVEASRKSHMLAIVADVVLCAVRALEGSTVYPVSVPDRWTSHEAIGAAIKFLNARGWAVDYRPGDNMLRIQPAVIDGEG